MSDITKCKGGECPIKKTCYRFTSKASDWQSYFTEIPLKDGKCDMYWEKKSEKIHADFKEEIEKL
jgi:hypothetical protein